MNPKIDSIEIRHYRMPFSPPFHASWDPRPRTEQPVTVARVTAGGAEGVGSGTEMAGFEGNEDLFLGLDPFEIERHARILDNLQLFYGRMWPLEVALWDLMANLRGEPLWQMLGGSSPTVRLYASTGARLPVEQRTEVAVQLREAGFEALKLRFYQEHVEDDIAVVRAVREAGGTRMNIMVDANQAWRMPWDASPAWDLKQARRVAAALSELNVFWLEEPLDRHDYAGLAALRRTGRVRIAGGEANREYADFRQYLKEGSLDVYQADVAWTTGFFLGRKLAEAARAAGAWYSPHTWGDGLVVLANLHAFCAFSRAPYVEFPYDPPLWTPEKRDYILPAPLNADANGSLTLPDAPGLGVALDWPALEKWRVK